MWLFSKVLREHVFSKYIIYQCILPMICTSTTITCFERKLDVNVPTSFGEPQETVLINFPTRSNSSEVVPSQLYLPPESSDTFLPEVIDNRARSFAVSSTSSTPSIIIIDDTTKIDLNTPLPYPQIDLEPPFRNGERDSRYYPYPMYLQRIKLTEQTSTRAGNSQRDLDTSFAGLVRVNEMSCHNSERELYFRASLTPSRKSDSPVIENANGHSCKINRIKGEYRIDFGKDQFWNCGVVDCSSESGRFYCLGLRFPTIAGLKLKEDFKVTLQCKTQEKIVSHTKQINVKTLDTSARMAPRVAVGGYKNNFETDVGLYRKTYSSESMFDVKVQSGGTVILGEEILLRALVREGDGWRYSRINEVTIHYVEKKVQDKIMNSLWILDSNGCLNPDIRDICSREQYRVSPLESYLLFEAFMFDNMKESDEMVLTVKVTGCLDGADCTLNCPAGHVRKARSVANNSHTVDWQNDIAFRVILPKRRVGHFDETYFTMFCILAVFVLTVVAGLLCLVKVLTKQRVSGLK